MKVLLTIDDLVVNKLDKHVASLGENRSEVVERIIVDYLISDKSREAEEAVKARKAALRHAR